MLAFIIAPFFIALLIFTYVRALKYAKIKNYKLLKVSEVIFGLLLFGGLFCIISGFLLPSDLAIKRTFTELGFYWLGFILYFFIAIAISLIIRIIIWLIKKDKNYSIDLARKITVVFTIAFTVLMSVYGIQNAHKLKITNYEVNVEKKSNLDELNVVLIADLHLGYNVGLSEIEDMTNKINELNPDVVVIAGDIFDNEYSAIEHPKQIINVLNSINAKYGKYATFGNHDIEEKILVGFTFNWSKQAKENAQASEQMIKFIEDSGFTILYDSYELIEDSVYIYGRPDAHKINLGNKNRVEAKDITMNLDKNKTIICVDHEPGDLDELSKAGVDIDLSGHTHNGQIWPGTISINWLWKNAYGIKQINNMTSIVTSGVGLFGVNMRTGCYPEIVNVNIKFKK